jgi:hypothetical protein
MYTNTCTTLPCPHTPLTPDRDSADSADIHAYVSICISRSSLVSPANSSADPNTYSRRTQHHIMAENLSPIGIANVRITPIYVGNSPS